MFKKRSNIRFNIFLLLAVPPKRGTKRPAQNSIEVSKETKIAKKKHEILIKSDLRKSNPGVVLSFGQGDVGQLGLGEDVLEKSRPAAIPKYEDLIAIAAGGMHSILLTNTGKVLTFGCNDEGALGRDTSEEGSETVPAEVSLPGKVIQVTAGDSHSAALLDDGRVFAWGSFRDSHGNMGLTTNGNEKTPVELLPLVKIVKLASGADHLVLLSESGHIYTCGCAEQGQLGRVPLRSTDRGNRHGISSLLKPALVEFKVTNKTVFENIWAGSYCTFAKDTKENMYVFGLNNYYQIGLKEAASHYHPRISKTFSGKNWTQISSGQHHTIALDENGMVYVMGRKEYGRLGLGSNYTDDATELIPVPVLSSIKCVDVGTGSAQSFAVTDSGELYSWGMGTNGQLGTGGEDDVESPVLVKGKQLEGKAVVRVSGGGQHTLILAVVRPLKEKTAG